MQGTDKQIAWAEQIRTAFIADVRTMEQQQAARAAAAGQGAEWAATVSGIIAQAEAQNDAAWWIDNRDALSVGGRGKAFQAMYRAAAEQVAKAK
jgi:hypothetical protein